MGKSYGKHFTVAGELWGRVIVLPTKYPSWNEKILCGIAVTLLHAGLAFPCYLGLHFYAFSVLLGLCLFLQSSSLLLWLKRFLRVAFNLLPDGAVCMKLSEVILPISIHKLLYRYIFYAFDDVVLNIVLFSIAFYAPRSYNISHLEQVSSEVTVTCHKLCEVTSLCFLQFCGALGGQWCCPKLSSITGSLLRHSFSVHSSGTSAVLFHSVLQSVILFQVEQVLSTQCSKFRVPFFLWFCIFHLWFNIERCIKKINLILNSTSTLPLNLPLIDVYKSTYTTWGDLPQPLPAD